MIKYDIKALSFKALTCLNQAVLYSQPMVSIRNLDLRSYGQLLSLFCNLTKYLCIYLFIYLHSFAIYTYLAIYLW